MEWRVCITWWIMLCIRYLKSLWIYYKKTWKKTDNHSIRVYINKTENRIKFRIKTWYYLEILMPETMKLFGSTRTEITKDKNSENVPHLEINRVVLVHCNIVNNDYQQDSRAFALLHNFIQQSLNSSFAQVQILLAACRRFEILRISDSSSGWK